MDKRKLLLWTVGSLIAVLSIVLPLIMFFDTAIATYLESDPLQIKTICEVLTGVGDAIVYFGIALVGLAISAWRGWRVWQYRFLFVLLALSSSGVLVRILKFIIGRQRPHITPLHDAMAFQPFSMHWSFHSMPSGHAQVCFAVATIMATLHPKGLSVYFTLAFLMSITRPLIGVHFVSDIIAGAWVGIIGVLWAKVIWDARIGFKRPRLLELRQALTG